jgi:hypothetical protein
MRIKNHNRRTIEIYKNDFDVLEILRTTELGKVTFANIVKDLVRTKMYCIKNNIPVPKEESKVERLFKNSQVLTEA